MIGKIKGELIQLSVPQVLVETASGVSYEIDISIPDCANLPQVGKLVEFYTHLVIREDQHLLFGFLKLEDRDCFRQLIKVSGIGPKIALALLSTLSFPELLSAIDSSDINTLCRTPGIGKKMAERMLLELKGKFQLKISADFITDTNILSPNNIKNDISNALNSLGYSDKEINPILKSLPNDIIDLGIGIKEALKLMTKNKSL